MRKLICIFALCCCVLLTMVAPVLALDQSCTVTDFLASTEMLDDGSTVKTYDMPCRYYMVRRSYDSNGNLTDTSDDWYNDCTFDVFSSDDAYVEAEIHPWYYDLMGSSYDPSEVGAVRISDIADGGAFSGQLDFYLDGAYAYLYDIVITCTVTFYDSQMERAGKVICPEIYIVNWSESQDDVASYTFDVPEGACYMSVQLDTSRALYGSIANYEAIKLIATIPAEETETPIPDDGGTSGGAADTESGGFLASIGSGVGVAISGAGRVVTALFTSGGALVLLLPVIGLGIALALVLYLIKRKSVRP